MRGNVYDAEVLYLDPSKDLAMMYAPKAKNHKGLELYDKKLQFDEEFTALTARRDEKFKEYKGNITTPHYISPVTYIDGVDDIIVMQGSFNAKAGHSGSAIVNKDDKVLGVVLGATPDKGNVVLIPLKQLAEFIGGYNKNVTCNKG